VCRLLLFSLAPFPLCFLVEKTAVAGSPSIGFCIELLLGSKYVVLAGVGFLFVSEAYRLKCWFGFVL